MITFTHDRQMTRYPFGRKTEHRRRFDQHAVDYFKRVEALGTSISVDERTNISSFIRGLKAVGAWESLVDFWCLRSTQNVGTGTVCVGLKGNNATLLNGITWGVNGMGTINTGEVRSGALVNPTDSTAWTFFAVYDGQASANIMAFSIDDAISVNFISHLSNWFGSNKVGFAINDTFGPWVSSAIFSTPAWAAGGFQSNQFNVKVGSAAVGRWQGNVSFAEIIGDPSSPLINAPGLMVRMSTGTATGLTGSCFGVWKGSMPNLHALVRETIGKGLSLP